MDAITIFGLLSVSAMLLFYALEPRGPHFVLAFAAACAFSGVYGFLQGAWPFGFVETVWTAVALQRWAKVRFDFSALVGAQAFRIARPNGSARRTISQAATRPASQMALVSPIRVTMAAVKAPSPPRTGVAASSANS
jgi:hypothetical protein